MEGNKDERVRKRGCSCTKYDFLPEESFKSWGNYVKALKETPFRFADRFTTRSMDSTELVEMKARSQHAMKNALNWWDLIWFGMGAVMGAGIFVLTGHEANEDAGPAVIISYVVPGISAMLSVFCYTEFAVEIPVAGEEAPPFADITICPRSTIASLPSFRSCSRDYKNKFLDNNRVGDVDKILPTEFPRWF